MKPEAFTQQIQKALANPELQAALDANAERRILAGQQSRASLPEPWEVMRRKAHAVRSEVIENLETYLEQFTAMLSQNGVVVHRAKDASQAAQIVLQIAQSHQVRLVAKSKSMVSEEIELNHELEAAGIDFDPRFVVEGVVAEGVSDARQRSRRALLLKLDKLRQQFKDDPQIQAFNEAEAQAYDLILGEAGKVFDLSTESEEMRARYGKTTFGQSCLMARRLVEKGVPYIAVNFGGWDTHKQHFQAMNQKLPQLDKGLSALIQDLSDRGLLSTTVVWWGGEFGRTPRVQYEAPWNGGRGHFGPVFSSLVAGGGFKGGQVVGASDSRGEEVKERPVYPNDLIGSIYTLLGIPPETKVPHPQGLDVPAVPTTWDGSSKLNLLKEIM
jgi:hypothetical protein